MVKKFGVVAFYVALLFYIVWEIYWYNQVGLTFIKWHTHMAFPFILFLFFYYLFKWMKVPKKGMNILFGIYLCIQFFEIFAQITGIGKTPFEKVHGHYVSFHPNHSIENYYWIDKPHSKKILRNTEFRFSRFTNSLGYSDVEWKKDTTKAILCLGDSFTEGDGAHMDSSYVAFLKNKLPSYQVMNAGKCGSDPFFNYLNYKDRLDSYDIEIVIQTISSQDLTQDIPQRGGLERFQKDRILKFQQKTSFNQFLFAISYVSRPFFYLMNYDEYAKKLLPEEKVIQYVEQLFIDYSKLVEERNQQLIIVVFPISDEIKDDYIPVTKECMARLSKKYTVIDLREFYLSKTTDKNYESFYWPEDRHHNAKGYQMMADGIYDFLKKNELIKF